MNYLNVKQLAEYIKLSESTIYKGVMRNRIPFIKANGKLLFRQETIDQWLDKHSHATVAELTNNISEFLKPQRKERQ